jgi:hypothetical protein
MTRGRILARRRIGIIDRQVAAKLPCNQTRGVPYIHLMTGSTQAQPIATTPATSSGLTASSKVATKQSTGLGWWLWTGLVSLVIAFLVFHFATQKKTYSQASPEDVLASMIQMVKDDNANRISDMIYADTPEMRSALSRLGGLFGSLQNVGEAVNEKFPKDVAALRERVKKEAAAAGGQDGILALLQSARPPTQRPGQAAVPRTAADRRARERQFQDIAARLMANPFEFLEEGANRLSVLKISDDTAVLRLDEQPLLGGILTMREREGRWWLMLPLNLPGVNQFAPQTKSEWAIIASLMKVGENTMNELAKDVRAGKAGTIDGVAQLAGEKAFLPAGIVMVMYGKEMDIRQRRERVMGQFRTAWRKWAGERSEDGMAWKKVEPEIALMITERVDQLARQRLADQKNTTMPAFEGMSALDLAAFVEQTLADAKIRVNLSEPLSMGQAEELAAAITKYRAAGIRVKRKP